jgi:hypothetical protein
MLSPENLQQNWLIFESRLTERLGQKPDFDGILLFVGIKEACLPPKNFTETEKVNLMQMAVCTVLVPARYYELFWVEDSGWPHYNQLQRLPEMTASAKEEFLKPYILMWAEKNRVI